MTQVAVAPDSGIDDQCQCTVEESDTADSETASLTPNSTPSPIQHSKEPNPREEGCVGQTFEKKYYEFENVFIKRNLEPSEYGVSTYDGEILVPYMALQRMKNEVATIRYVQKHTDIPTPSIRCAFEDNGRLYLIEDIVPGVTIAKLSAEKRSGPIKQVEDYMTQMHTMKSNIMGGIAGDNILPYRFTDNTIDKQLKYTDIKFRDTPAPEFVFCHSDLAQHNVIVDQETLRVKAVLDWEYAGFYPAEFDGKFYLRPGPSVALEGEEDNLPKLLEILGHWMLPKEVAHDDNADKSTIDVNDVVAPDEQSLDDISPPLPKRPLKEEGCVAITYEKKYYEFENVFIKRSLAPSELTIAPYMCLERMKNEVAAIRYIQKNTDIPTPNIRCAFEDNGRYYIITDVVPGLTIAELPAEKRAGPIKEVEAYMAQMHTIKSKVMGGFAGNHILPHRLAHDSIRNQNSAELFGNLKFREAPTGTPEFVLCHNDLSQHNVIVDEETLRVKAILDWEYAGFYPPEFDGRYYLRPGASAALEGEEDDVSKLMEVLEYWKV